MMNLGNASVALMVTGLAHVEHLLVTDIPLSFIHSFIHSGTYWALLGQLGRGRGIKHVAHHFDVWHLWPCSLSHP